MPGSLSVTKIVNLNNVVNPSAINKNFAVTISGASYPIGTTLTYQLVNGVLQDPTQTLNNLIPGSYSINEFPPGPDWDLPFFNGPPLFVTANGTASTTLTNTFLPGSLDVRKVLDLGSIINPAGVNQTFTANVTGPSYPGGITHDFVVTGGSAPPSWFLPNLIPGTYTITETPVPGWIESVTPSPIEVVSEDPEDGFQPPVEITNTLIPGSLQIKKTVNLNGADPSTVNQTFTANVTGPSYPNGHLLTFDVISGGLVTPTQTLPNLIPGSYTITETPVNGWTEVVSSSPMTVPPGPLVTANITNSLNNGILQVNKSVILGQYHFPATVDRDFTVKVTGPSYPAGTNLVLHVVDGAVTNSPKILINLAPGTYNVDEIDPGIAWSVAGEGNVSVANNQTTSANVTNTLLFPHTTMTFFPFGTVDTPQGKRVTLTMSDTNDGQVPLTNAHVHVRQIINSIITDFPLLGWSSVIKFSGGNSDSIMDVGETWTWQQTFLVNQTTTFEVRGHGTDPLGNPVDYPDYQSEFQSTTYFTSVGVPGFSNLGIGIMILGFAGAMLLLIRRRSKRFND